MQYTNSGFWTKTYFKVGFIFAFLSLYKGGIYQFSVQWILVENRSIFQTLWKANSFLPESTGRKIGKFHLSIEIKM